MTTQVVPGPQDELSDVATQLLKIADELGYQPGVVSITHDPGQVFVVPDDVADRWSANRQAKAEETSPRRRVKAKEVGEDA